VTASVGKNGSRSSLVYQLKESPYGSHSILLRLLPKEGRGASILDVGCGNGRLSALLVSRGYVVTGLERAGGYDASFPRNVELVEADLEQGVPELNGEFDYVICADVLEHVRRPARLLEQLRSFMKPGGQLIASLPNSGNIYFRLNVALGRFPRRDRGLFDRTHVWFYTLKTWRELLAESGFRAECWRVTGMPLGLAFPRLAHSLPVRAAERISYDLARIWRTLFAYEFVLRATVEDGTTARRPQCGGL
jgi:SAM-dependent methyltransferase